jgi:hypothetical protein
MKPPPTRKTWRDDALFRLHREIGRMRSVTSFVSHRTYRTLWDFHESRGERPWAHQFHALARRRFAKELASCLW